MKTHLESLPGFNRLLSCCAEKEAYLVGGTLRDWILQRPLNDIDLVTPEDPTRLAKEFATSSGGSWFWLDEARLQSRVVIKDDNNPIYYDFASFRSTNLASDLAERDFTINALAVPLIDSSWQWIDPLHGIDDFSTKTLRSCRDSAFTEDPLRCLRAVRFSLQLGFSPDVDTLNLIHAAVPSLERTPGERIHAELALIFGSPHAHRGLELFDRLGLTAELFSASLSASALIKLARKLKQDIPPETARMTADSFVANGFSRMALIRFFSSLMRPGQQTRLGMFVIVFALAGAILRRLWGWLYYQTERFHHYRTPIAESDYGWKTSRETGRPVSCLCCLLHIRTY